LKPDEKTFVSQEIISKIKAFNEEINDNSVVAEIELPKNHQNLLLKRLLGHMKL